MAKKKGLLPMGIPLDASLRSYDAKAVSDGTALHTGSETLVQQHLKDEVDINTIVRRFGLTRDMPAGAAGGVYGDFTGISDYDGALEAIRRAREGFMVLPPEVRERFGNDPGRLIRFAQESSPEAFDAAMKPAVTGSGASTAPAPGGAPGGVEPPPVSDS